MKLLEQITENTKNISDECLISQLDIAAKFEQYSYSGDVTLSRIIYSITVILNYKYSDSLMFTQVRANNLNTLRMSFNYKPDGFDQLLKEIQDSFLIGCVDDAGLGIEQLTKLCWLFNFNTLKEENLLFLRERSGWNV